VLHISKSTLNGNSSFTIEKKVDITT